MRPSASIVRERPGQDNACDSVRQTADRIRNSQIAGNARCAGILRSDSNADIDGQSISARTMDCETARVGDVVPVIAETSARRAASDYDRLADRRVSGSNRHSRAAAAGTTRLAAGVVEGKRTKTGSAVEVREIEWPASRHRTICPRCSRWDMWSAGVVIRHGQRMTATELIGDVLK